MLTGGYRGFEDASVTVLDKLTYAGNLANLEPVANCAALTFIRGDICDACCGAGWEMVRRVTDRKDHDRRYCLDDSALRALGYAPRIPLRAGLAATVQWYRDNRRWWEPLRQQGLAVAAS